MPCCDRVAQLLRPEACNQRIHVEHARYEPETKVLSFRCGVFDCPKNEKWDLFTDGTIRPRDHPHLAIGMGRILMGDQPNILTILVNQGDPRRLVFQSVLSAARGA